MHSKNEQGEHSISDEKKRKGGEIAHPLLTRLMARDAKNYWGDVTLSANPEFVGHQYSASIAQDQEQMSLTGSLAILQQLLQDKTHGETSTCT
jgi:hypothetical protein